MKLKNYFLNRKVLIANLIMLFIGGAAMAQGNYCTPNFSLTCGSGYMIGSVSSSGGITDITNNNTNCGNSTTSYSDYTTESMRITQDALKSVTVKVTYPSSAPGGSSALTRVYVDWNQNDTFEVNATPSEYIAPNVTTDHVHTGPGTSVNVKITVPGQAKNGLTRMRVVLGSNGPIYDPNTNPCGAARGEAEDYNFEVVNPCLPPNVISTTNIDYKSVDISWTPKLNATMYEYLIKRDNAMPASNGYSYTTVNTLEVDTLECDVQYYIFVRIICDSSGTHANWDISDWVVDSFKTEPCCYAPDLTISDITSTTTKVSWLPVQTAYGYEYAVTTTPNPPQQGTYTTKTTILLQGLQSKTTHFVHVRSRCAPTPLSDWSRGQFKTLKSLAVNTVPGIDFNMDAYPNPLQDKLVVQLNGKMDKNARIVVTELTGKVVYTSNVTTNKVTINAENFVPGIYIVKYMDDTHNEIMRVVKQ